MRMTDCLHLFQSDSSGPPGVCCSPINRGGAPRSLPPWSFPPCRPISFEAGSPARAAAKPAGSMRRREVPQCSGLATGSFEESSAADSTSEGRRRCCPDWRSPSVPCTTYRTHFPLDRLSYATRRRLNQCSSGAESRAPARALRRGSILVSEMDHLRGRNPSSIPNLSPTS